MTTKPQCRNRSCRKRFLPKVANQVYCENHVDMSKNLHQLRHAEQDYRREHKTFVGVDGEGITGPCQIEACNCSVFVDVEPESNHEVFYCTCGHEQQEHRHLYVLLGVGEEQIADP